MPLKPPALDPATVEPSTTSAYPEPFKSAHHGRAKRLLTKALGLTQFGVNLTHLAPGGGSALRHWHSHEDEFVMVLSGSPTLITDDGEQQLQPGVTVGFPAGVKNGHCIVNNTDEPVTILEVGSRDMRDEGNYPDVDLHCHPGRYEKPVFTKKNGEAYE